LACDTEEEEDKQIEKLNIKTTRLMKWYRGLETCVAEALSKVAHCEVLYISFDVDSMDCDMISYGTGTPVPKGLISMKLLALSIRLLKPKVVCIEFVEVNLLLDTKGIRWQKLLLKY
jgi:arginase